MATTREFGLHERHVRIPLPLLERGKAIDLARVKRRNLVNYSIIGLAIVLAVIDFWAVFGGYVTNGPERQLAALVALGSLFLLLSGLLSSFSLTTSTAAYQRLALIQEATEVEEATKQTQVLIEVVRTTAQEVLPKGERQKFIQALARDKHLQQCPGLEDQVKEELLHAVA